MSENNGVEATTEVDVDTKEEAPAFMASNNTIKEHIKSVDSIEELNAIAEKEVEGENRSGALKAIKERIDKLTPSEEDDSDDGEFDKWSMTRDLVLSKNATLEADAFNDMKSKEKGRLMGRLSEKQVTTHFKMK